MRPTLGISLAPEMSDEGDPAERACFGLFTMRANGADLTGGMDFFITAYRSGPLVSGYHAAAWLAWNWWRLCHEPRSSAPEWWRSHRMTAIGEGYAWPNITIFSDGARTTILAEQSARPDAKPFRYIGSAPCVLPTVQFQWAVDAFVSSMQARLRAQGVDETALDRIWRDVTAERGSPELARRRRLEALLGRDPDAIEDQLVDRLITEAAEVGEPAVEELAAHGGQGAPPPSVAELRRSARENGYEARPGDAVRPIDGGPEGESEAPAWRIGAQAARALRARERLGADPIGDDRLAALAGVASQVLEGSKLGQGLSFTMDQTGGTGRVVLRSKWRTSRRFELARLLADRMITPIGGPLRVATGARTHRQKTQRAFAAELLSPFEAVAAMLDGDYSAEARADVAAHFEVSEWTILTLLVNHQRLEQDELADDFRAAA